MNTLVAVAIAPFGEGDELAEYVAEVVNAFFFHLNCMCLGFCNSGC